MVRGRKPNSMSFKWHGNISIHINRRNRHRTSFQCGWSRNSNLSKTQVLSVFPLHCPECQPDPIAPGRRAIRRLSFLVWSGRVKRKPLPTQSSLNPCCLPNWCWGHVPNEGMPYAEWSRHGLTSHLWQEGQVTMTGLELELHKGNH